MSKKVIVYGSEQKASKQEPKVKDFTPSRTVTKNLSDLLNQIIYIHGYETQKITIKGNETEIIFVDVSLDSNNVERYHTFSTILKAQLEALKEQFQQGYVIRAKLVRVKRYLTLTQP
jgi:exosome complex RNA-binding protein Csl4